MSDLQAGTRVFLTAVGCDCHPPVGTSGTVLKVVRTDGLDDHNIVTVRWDNGRESTVTRWNAVIARAGC